MTYLVQTYALGVGLSLLSLYFFYLLERRQGRVVVEEDWSTYTWFAVLWPVVLTVVVLIAVAFFLTFIVVPALEEFAKWLVRMIRRFGSG